MSDKPDTSKPGPSSGTPTGKSIEQLLQEKLAPAQATRSRLDRSVESLLDERVLREVLARRKQQASTRPLPPIEEVEETRRNLFQEQPEFNPDSSSEEEDEEVVFVRPPEIMAQQALTDVLEKLDATLSQQKSGFGAGYKLEKFECNRHDPHQWWDRFEKFCKIRDTKVEILFPLYVDDQTSAWYNTLKNHAELKKQFLSEFGDFGKKHWEHRRELHAMRQGTDPTREYIRKVIAKAARVFDKSKGDFSDTESQEIVTVLMGGFREKVKTLVLTRGATTLEDVMEAAKDAKLLDESAEVTPIVAVVQETVKEAIKPLFEKLKISSDKFRRSPSPKENRTRSTSPLMRGASAQQGNSKPTGKKVRFSNSSKPKSTSKDQSKKCFNCGKPGHFKRDCKQLRKSAPRFQKRQSRQQQQQQTQQQPQQQMPIQTQAGILPIQAAVSPQMVSQPMVSQQMVSQPCVPANQVLSLSDRASLRQVDCWTCGGIGHLSTECPSKPAGKRSAKSQPGPQFCSLCKVGHTPEECWYNPENRQ